VTTVPRPKSVEPSLTKVASVVTILLLHTVIVVSVVALITLLTVGAVVFFDFGLDQ